MRGITKKITALLIATSFFATSGCTFKLSSGAIPTMPKSKEQIEIDTLACQNEAHILANKTGRQVGYFFLGLTIIGIPIALSMDRSYQRNIYKSCMEARNYQVIPVNMPPPGANNALKAPAASTPPAPTKIESQTQDSNQTQKDAAEQLRTIKELHKKGLITTEEYEKKRKEILDRI
jgi:hypothetical protein